MTVDFFFVTTHTVWMHAHERFTRWFAATGLTQRQLAERLGCRQATVSDLIRAKHSPSLRLAFSIESESVDWPEGPIYAREWPSSPASLRQRAGE